MGSCECGVGGVVERQRVGRRCVDGWQACSLPRKVCKCCQGVPQPTGLPGGVAGGRGLAKQRSTVCLQAAAYALEPAAAVDRTHVRSRAAWAIGGPDQAAHASLPAGLLSFLQPSPFRLCARVTPLVG